MTNEPIDLIIKNSFSKIAGLNVFLTGGTGFFGKSFLDLYIKYSDIFNIRLTILSRSPQEFLASYPQYKHSKITWLKGEITNFTFPEQKFDVILHFATPADAKMNLTQPLLMCSTIVDGMSHILDFAQQSGCKKFLFASSGAVYGTQPSDLSNVSESYLGSPSPLAPDAAYGEAKRYAELLGYMTARNSNFEFKVARCFAFVGRHLNRHGMYAIGNFIGDALSDQTIHIKGDGTAYRSYLYADDLIVWLLTILIDGKNHEAYNVGSDQAINIKDLANQVNTSLKKSCEIQIHQVPKPGASVARYVPSTEKARTELGLQVWTPLDQAITLSVT